MDLTTLPLAVTLAVAVAALVGALALAVAVVAVAIRPSPARRRAVNMILGHIVAAVHAWVGRPSREDEKNSPSRN